MPQRIRTELANEVSQNFPRELLECIEKYWSECESSRVANSTLNQSIKPHLAMFFRWVVDDYTPKSGSPGSNDIRALRSLV